MQELDAGADVADAGYEYDALPEGEELPPMPVHAHSTLTLAPDAAPPGLRLGPVQPLHNVRPFSGLPTSTFRPVSPPPPRALYTQFLRHGRRDFGASFAVRNHINHTHAKGRYPPNFRDF